MLKRLFDIAISAVGLFFLSPLFLGIAVAIVVSMGRPVIFVQSRPGWQGRPFNLVKFRTMTGDFGENGQVLPDSARMTRLGRFLRSLSLDELPELWNVLRGDMSLVGPRPLLMEYLPLYSSEQARRHAVRPGLTGWAQVKGRNLLSWERKFELDVWYVDNHSFLLDLQILWLTIGTVIRREGISNPGETTMPKFRGNAT